VLGGTGRNFAAGMSGGVAYVLDETEQSFETKCNKELVHLQKLSDSQELKDVYEMIEKHVQYTNSALGQRILNNWNEFASKFVRVIPRDYLAMQDRIKSLKESGMEKFDAEMTAFEERNKPVETVK
jgi:glutamate synthase (NADPH/NADH) large chain